jgi:hypothetical protein
MEDGSAIFAGLLLGYLAFITVHYAVHRWPIRPNSWLYSAKLRHLTHHRFENCNFGVTTSFWDIVFRTCAGIIGERLLPGLVSPLPAGTNADESLGPPCSPKFPTVSPCVSVGCASMGGVAKSSSRGDVF